MRKYISLLLIGILCIGFVQGQTKSSKRGLAFNGLGAGDIETLGPSVSWVYNWGQSVGNVDLMDAAGIEYAPMAFGNGFNANNLLTFVAAHPSIQYLLGFNEPSQPGANGGCNLSPVQAAAIWSSVVSAANELGLKVVSPAMSYGASSDPANPNNPIDWLDEFFTLVDINDIDAIAVHCYYSSYSQVINYINMFKKYHKPIWLTEFCYEAGSGSPAVSDQIKFMVQTLDYLESDPDIERYSWFKERGSTTGSLGNNSILVPMHDGELSDLGVIFTNISSHDQNYVFNTDFHIPACQYANNNYSVTNLELSTDETGAVVVCGLNSTSWMEYKVNIPEAGDYHINFRMSNEFAPPVASSVKVLANDIEVGNLTFDNPGQNLWTTQTCNVSLNQGIQTIKIAVSQGRPCLNWFEITQNTDAIDNIFDSDNINIFPNPVKDILFVQNADANSNVKIFDISGKIVYSNKISDGTVDMTSLSSGMYFLNIENNKGKTIVKKLLKGTD